MGIRHSPIRRIDAVGYGDGWQRDPEWLGDRLYERGGRQDTTEGRGGSLVSVGVGIDQLPAPIEQIDRVPTLVSVPPPPPPPYDPPSPPGGTEPPQPEELPVSWSDWLAAGNALPADWNSYPHASDHPDISGVTYEPTTVGIETTGEEPLSILGDIYDIVDTAVGGWLPGGVAVGGPSPVFQPGSNFNYASPPPLNPAIVPAAGTTVAVTPGSTDGMKGMVYKKVCGQYRWVKQSRRRRKNLATKGDLKDLAALKGILGNGKAFEVWIATHS